MAKANNLTYRVRGAILSPLLFGMLVSTPVQALELNWYGASCLSLEDENSVIIVDPFVTRPSLMTVLLNQGLVSNKALVANVFKKFASKKDIAILITHNHFDHVLDLPEVLKLLPQAKVFGPANTKDLLKKFKSLKSEMTVVSSNGQYKVGAFDLKSFEVKHSPLPLNIMFAHGEMRNDTQQPLGAFDYRAQKSFSFSIKHPEGDTLLHPTAEPRSYDIKEVDNLIVGATSRSVDALKSQVIDKISHKKLITIHNDNFFKPYNKPITKMPFAASLGGELKGRFPKVFTLSKAMATEGNKENSHE